LAASSHSRGNVSKMAAGGMRPPLPMTSKPELRTASAGSLRIGPAISPIWTRRVLVGSAISSWPVRAATSASVGRPQR
jgi:hypothetical protein